MDPIEAIKPWKDSTLAMMLEAQARGWQLFYFRLEDLFFDDGIGMGQFRTLAVHDDNEHWFDYAEAGRCRLDELDAILMRKDPPFARLQRKAVYPDVPAMLRRDAGQS